MSPLATIRAGALDRSAGAWWAARTRLERVGARLIEPRSRFVGTHERVPLAELGLGHPDRVDYVPSGWLFLRRALRGRKVGPGDVFVDFGSGKGRVLYHAARLPFGRVIGVEIAEELSDVARSNLQRNHRRLRCRDVRVVTSDVASFPIPDDITYAYFFNPFGAEIFGAVIERIVASLDRRPRDLTLIYANPVEAACVERTGRFTLETLSAGRREWDTIAVYRSASA
jgi:SAM-dependent methyltransferase